MILEVFKIVNKQSPLFLQDFVQIRNSNYKFRYQTTVELTTRCGKQSFSYASLWNSSPNHVRGISTFDQFIDKLLTPGEAGLQMQLLSMTQRGVAWLNESIF